MGNTCGVKNVGIVSLDSLAGNSKYWREREEELRKAGYRVEHVDIFDQEHPEPGFFDFIFKGPDGIVSELNWGKVLRSIDQTVGEFKKGGCEEIVGLGGGLGGNFLLLYRDGPQENQTEENGGWFPKLEHQAFLRRIVAAYPHAQFPTAISLLGRRQIRIDEVTKPTFLVYGEEDEVVMPLSKSNTWLKEVDRNSRNLEVHFMEGAGHLFMHADAPIMTFNDWNPGYNEEAAKKAWQLMFHWIQTSIN